MISTQQKSEICNDWFELDWSLLTGCSLGDAHFGG